MVLAQFRILDCSNAQWVASSAYCIEHHNLDVARSGAHYCTSGDRGHCGRLEDLELDFELDSLLGVCQLPETCFAHGSLALPYIHLSWVTNSNLIYLR